MRYALSLIFALFGCSAGHPTTSVSITSPTPTPVVSAPALPGAAVFDVLANDHFRVRLRVDRAADGQLLGRFKNYAFDNSMYECPEEDIMVTRWDGTALEFERPLSGASQFYAGAISGDAISGTFTQGERRFNWTGRRAELLTYGLAEKTAEDRAAWQAQTRRELFRLMMAGNPAPLSVNVEILAADQPPIAGVPYPLRDDEPHLYPQDYTLTELRLTYTLPGATRSVHAYLAKPNTGEGPYPLVVALNGHLGSAHKVMDGSTMYWYGDAWARRGYMVLAVDVGHRPSSDVARSGTLDDLSTYLGYPGDNYPGDDPAHGNGLKPAISAEWEENGERVYDVMRAIDYAVSRSDVDAGRIIATGLSLGGEVATYVAALDERISVAVISGYSPDFSVFKYKQRVGHCWHWGRNDIRDYIDRSDLLSLIAPRPLIAQTGQTDQTYSIFPQDPQILPPFAVSSLPFAGDKQAIRRARVAGGPILHFLHPLAHQYRAGVVTYTVSYDQVSAETATDGRNLFEYVRGFLGV